MNRFVKWAVGLTAVIVLVTGCTPVQQGAGWGSALGAGAGALIGHANGDSGKGALIGAGSGALLGALAGDYHNTYVSPRAPRYVERPVYVDRPVYVERPVYVAAPPPRVRHYVIERDYYYY